MNVTVRNVITSMRSVSWFDWAQFVESVSLVDDVLRERSAFGEMDFATRDRYRNAIEELARGSGLTEVDVARHRDRDGRLGDGRRRRRTGGRRSPSRARLLPDLRRPRRARTCARTSECRCRAACGAPSCGPRRPGYRPDARARHGAAPRRAAPARRRTEASPPARSSSPSSPSARRPIWRRARQPGVTKTLGPQPLPRARPRRRRADGDAHARRGADAPHRRGGGRGPRRWPRGPLPRQSRGRPAVRPAVGLARRRRPSTSPGDDELLADGGGGDRPAQRAPRRGARGRRPVPAVPPRRDAGTRPRAAGWAGSASAASSTS